jgi:hypothetical protein
MEGSISFRSRNARHCWNCTVVGRTVPRPGAPMSCCFWPMAGLSPGPRHVARWLSEKTPQDFGYFRSRWSCDTLAEMLAWELGSRPLFRSICICQYLP